VVHGQLFDVQVERICAVISLVPVPVDGCLEGFAFFEKAKINDYFALIFIGDTADVSFF